MIINVINFLPTLKALCPLFKELSEFFLYAEDYFLM